MLGVGLDGWEVVFWSGAAQFKKKVPRNFGDGLGNAGDGGSLW